MRTPWYAQRNLHLVLDVILFVLWMLWGAAILHRCLRHPETGAEIDGVLWIAFGVFWLYQWRRSRQRLRAQEGREASIEELRQRTQRERDAFLVEHQRRLRSTTGGETGDDQPS